MGNILEQQLARHCNEVIFNFLQHEGIGLDVNLTGNYLADFSAIIALPFSAITIGKVWELSRAKLNTSKIINEKIFCRTDIEEYTEPKMPVKKSPYLIGCIILEFAQKYNLDNGSFDPKDIVAHLAGYIALIAIMRMRGTYLKRHQAKDLIL